VKKSTEVYYRYSILCISNQYFGVEVKHVKEVQLLPAITKIPNVHSSVLGVFNLRGQIQSIVDISGFLNLALDKISDESFVVLIEYKNTSLGLLVEKVLDVLQIESDKIQIPGRDMPLSIMQYCSGWYNHESLGKVFLLDLETLFNAKEIGSYSYLMGA